MDAQSRHIGADIWDKALKPLLQYDLRKQAADDPEMPLDGFEAESPAGRAVDENHSLK